MSDPYAPGWQPEHRPDHDLGDVGSGPGFGADLFQLYRAGRQDMPATAATYAELTHQVHRLDQPLRRAFTVDGDLNPANRRILELRDELQHVLRQTSLHIEEAGRTLVTIADRYVAADADAAERMRSRLDGARDEFADPPPPIPHRPAPGDPPVTEADHSHSDQRWH